MIRRRDLLSRMGTAALAWGAGLPLGLSPFAARAATQAAGIGVSYGWDPDLSAPTDADFYVAPDGSDAGPGSVQQPFATVQRGVEALRSGAGRSLAIRGGIYREAVRLGDLAGQDGAPVLIHRYGSERVTLSGADVVTGWTPCTAADEAALGVALDGVQVVRLPLTAIGHGAPLALNLHEAGTWLSVATLRADETRIEASDDPRAYYKAQPLLTGDQRVAGFIDPRLKGLTAAQLVGARLLCYHFPNIVSLNRIAQFDTTTGTVMLEDQGQKVQVDGNVPTFAYALQNIATALTPGRWLVREEAEGQTIALYLRPMDPAHLDGGIEVSLRTSCLDMGQAAFVELAGLEFVQSAGADTARGPAIVHVPGAKASAHDIGIRHCRIGDTLSSSGRGDGAVFLRGVDNLTLRNVTVEHARNSFGLAVHDCRGADMRYLHLRSISQSPGRFFGVQQMIFAFSLLEDAGWGAHANQFNFYQGSDSVLVYGIRSLDVSGYVTYQKASRIHFAFCEFCASLKGGDNRALVSQNAPHGEIAPAPPPPPPDQDPNAPKPPPPRVEPYAGGTFHYWNLWLAPAPNMRQAANALSVGPGASTQHHSFHNLILFGGGFGDGYTRGGDLSLVTRSHNLYTGLNYWQNAAKGWQLAAGEAIGRPVDAGNGHARGLQGRDMRDVIAELAPVFPAFTDWDRDIDFRRVDWSVPPVGCRAG